MHKILVVDDDKLIRWSLKEMLTQEGYDVDAVSTIKDALDQAANNPYHLIIADFEISEELCIEMLKEINNVQPSTKIIILSAYAKHQIEPKLGTLKIFSIVEKPFQVEQIKTIAKEVLNENNS